MTSLREGCTTASPPGSMVLLLTGCTAKVTYAASQHHPQIVGRAGGCSIVGREAAKDIRIDDRSASRAGTA